MEDGGYDDSHLNFGGCGGQAADDEEDDTPTWDQDHDFSQLAQDYSEDICHQDVANHFFETLQNDSNGKSRRLVERSQLNEGQRLAHDCIVLAITQKEESSTDGGPGIGRLQIFHDKGGCGKSFVLDAVLTTLEEEHDIHLPQLERLLA